MQKITTGVTIAGTDALDLSNYHTRNKFNFLAQEKLFMVIYINPVDGDKFDSVYTVSLIYFTTNLKLEGLNVKNIYIQGNQGFH